tara:strand:- start:50 stop:394 length:345 start_codon:yes stop_codon:yes gene_type:complete
MSMIDTKKMREAPSVKHNKYTRLQRCIVCGTKFPKDWDTTSSDNEVSAARESKPGWRAGLTQVWHGERIAYNGLFCKLQCALRYATHSFILSYEKAEEKKNQEFGDKIAKFHQD